ncbi:unnamed protein product [Allacma fusca]|uniref:Uncharacterized protein n=1 Tax=Allacma fusca TaxID=39272 RepID=A0A8J2Q2P3_9HEXA|nr:unnamed protein product [Allacma fusca]
MKDDSNYNYEDFASPDHDYILEPVEPFLDEPEVTTLPENPTNSSVVAHGDEELVASASAAIVFLLVFTCFLPFLFMLYYFYIKDGAPIKGNFRLWLLKSLGAADPCSEPQHRASLDSDESQPLIQPPERNEQIVKSLKGTPRDTKKFRENSRDIYIKMADYPVDVSIQERETSDNDSSSPDISDELHITSGAKPKPKSGKKIKPEKKAQAKPVYNRLYDANDSEESEEMFSKYGKNRDIHDFTDWRPKGGGRKKIERQTNKIPPASSEQNRRQGTHRESNKASLSKHPTGLPLQHLGTSDEDEEPNTGQNSRDSQNLSQQSSSRALFDIS